MIRRLRNAGNTDAIQQVVSTGDAHTMYYMVIRHVAARKLRVPAPRVLEFEELGTIFDASPDD